MFQCEECYLSSQKYYATLEELEIHLAIEHYKLNIYECFLCPYAKFPTESTLVDHYRYTHSITSAIKVNYTLDLSTIEIRRKIQRSLSKSVAILESIIQLKSNPFDESTEDIKWIPSKEIISYNHSSDSTKQNFEPHSSGEFLSAEGIIDPEFSTGTCHNSNDIDDTNSTNSLKTCQYSTMRSKFASMAERYSNLLLKSCANDKNNVPNKKCSDKLRRSCRKSSTQEVFQINVAKGMRKKPKTSKSDNYLPKLYDKEVTTETGGLPRNVCVSLEPSSACLKFLNFCE